MRRMKHSTMVYAVARLSGRPVKIESVAQSFKGATTSTIEQTPSHLWTQNWRHDWRVGLVCPTLELTLPGGLSVLVRAVIQAGNQCRRDGGTILRREGQRLSQERRSLSFHHVIVIGVSSIQAKRIVSIERRGGERQRETHRASSQRSIESRQELHLIRPVTVPRDGQGGPGSGRAGVNATAGPS